MGTLARGVESGITGPGPGHAHPEVDELLDLPGLEGGNVDLGGLVLFRRGGAERSEAFHT
jgi:hypothetical protein